MAELLGWIRDGLANISEDAIVEPEYDLEPDDEIIGVLKDVELRKLWTLIHRYFDDARAVAHIMAGRTGTLQHSFGDDHDVTTCEYCKDFCNIVRMDDRLHTLIQLFWAGVRDELSEEVSIQSLRINRDGIGICRDWKIVLCKGNGDSGGVVMVHAAKFDL